MLKQLALLRDPLGLARRLVFKLMTGPRRYRSQGGYDAAAYWGDRFRNYGRSLRGAGDEGLSEAQNQHQYEEAATVFLGACRSAGVDFPSARVLEIGCGTGFYTRLMVEQGVRDYTGLDITDALFDEFRRELPQYRFVQQDVTEAAIEGTFDLILMIDVVEHIVEEPRLAFLLRSVRAVLAEGGVFIISGPLRERGSKRFFYLRFWTRDDVERHFLDFHAAPAVASRGGFLLSFRKPAAAGEEQPAA